MGGGEGGGGRRRGAGEEEEGGASWGGGGEERGGRGIRMNHGRTLSTDRVSLCYSINSTAPPNNQPSQVLLVLLQGDQIHHRRFKFTNTRRGF